MQRTGVAIGTALDHLADPVALAAQCCLETGLLGPRDRVACGGTQQRRHAADQVLTRHTGDA